MGGFGHNYASASIEDLASAELIDWFVWDNLAIPAYARAGANRKEAIALLAQAIARLAEADEELLSSGSGKPMADIGPILTHRRSARARSAFA
jgi:hypothetical protein